MKKIFGILSCIIALTALAELPLFSIVGPPPSIFDVTLSYSVTNNAPYALNNISLQYGPTGLTAPSFTQITSGTNACGSTFSLNAGASCILYYQIDSTKLVNDLASGGPEICYSTANPIYCSIPDSASRLNLTRGTPNLLVGVTGTTPFAIETYLVGGTWTSISTPVPAPPVGSLVQVACNESLCAASGLTPSSPPYAPFVISSIDDGFNWEKTALPSLSATLSVVSACAPGFEGRCIVATTTTTGADNVPYVNEFDYGSSSWVQDLTISGSALLRTAACTTDYCVVAGQTHASLAPIKAKLYYSLTSGWTPYEFTVSSDGTSPRIMDMFCQGSSCLGIGSQTVAGVVYPFTVQSFNGSTWTVVDARAVGPFDSPPVVQNSLSCTSSYCVAAGYNPSTLASKLIQSSNYGIAWTEVTSLGSVASGAFVGVGCSASICVAVGSATAGTPIMGQTKNQGTTWTAVPITLPSTAVMLTANCSGDACFISGYNSSTGAPIVYQTVNAGETWSAAPFSPALPAQARFFSGTAQ